MIPKQFAFLMDDIIEKPATADVRRDGLALIKRELGAGMPGFMPAIYDWIKALETTHTQAQLRAWLEKEARKGT